MIPGDHCTSDICLFSHHRDRKILSSGFKFILSPCIAVLSTERKKKFVTNESLELFEFELTRRQAHKSEQLSKQHSPHSDFQNGMNTFSCLGTFFSFFSNDLNVFHN